MKPRLVVGALARGDLREPQVMFFALLACALIFVSQWPILSRAATLDPSVTFEQRMGGAMFGIMFLLPLLLYGFAALLKLGLRLSGRIVPGILARLALFWSLLTVTPLMLVQGGLSAFLGPVGLTQGFGFVVLLVFLYILVKSVSAVRGIAAPQG
ncbi:YIP1 family protein [Roseibaca sp. Y0-43]|uniref:YIP1 family protein n=1 Tax=Roseibaca sp. Y0-43 TaxID=2816854 RepID=UPI001D0C54F2|nr:YIP1 family protein [Roseibaca sp. Y0-43]MCC1481702.1 YIP1 family protein [Roseibaca sp. Y0-43]